jgi:hypothetical protein
MLQRARHVTWRPKANQPDNNVVARRDQFVAIARTNPMTAAAYRPAPNKSALC